MVAALHKFSGVLGAFWRRPATTSSLIATAQTPHAYRRTNITLGGERGVSLKMRQLAVGHGSSAVTERYDHARKAATNAPGTSLRT